jgi:hypothetical protein
VVVTSLVTTVSATSHFEYQVKHDEFLLSGHIAVTGIGYFFPTRSIIASPTLARF